jgi:sugar lactone lactonase YvrE
MGNSFLSNLLRRFLVARKHYLLFGTVVVTVFLLFLTQTALAEIIAVDQIGGFKSPTRIAIAESGDIYVADHKKGTVEIFDNEGEKLGILDGFIAPLGVAVHETPSTLECEKWQIDDKNDTDPNDGNEGNNEKCKNWIGGPGQTILYVGDEGNGSVKIFTDGQNTGVLGSGSGEFIMPNAIAVTSDQTVYVVDSKANQVMVYDSSGTLQTVFGTLGFDFPSDIALNETAWLAGELYVTDYNNRRIRVYDLEGGWLRDISAPLNDSGDPLFYRPAGLGIDQEGNLYVVDNSLSCVAKISNLGIRLDTIGYTNGEYWTGELSVPVDAAVYGAKIFVTSNKQRQLRVFEVLP